MNTALGRPDCRSAPGKPGGETATMNVAGNVPQDLPTTRLTDNEEIARGSGIE